MIIYIDLIILINYIFDFNILTCTDLILRRGVKSRKILIASLTGELSLISFIFDIKGFCLFLIKIFTSFLMNYIAFGFKNIKYFTYNIIYFYLSSLFLGGFIYFIFNQFKIDLIFSIRYLVIILLSPFALLVYYKFISRIKENYNNYYDIKIVYENHTFNGIGFLDSGNNLFGYGKPVILVEKKYINYQKLKLLPVVYNALNHTGIVFCFKPESTIINGKSYDVLIGLSDKNFNIDGANALLNSKLEGLWF